MRPAWCVQGSQKRDESGGLGRIQAVAVRWHVAAALQYLADQLVLSQPFGYCVERGTALATLFSQGVTTAALLVLEDKRSLPFEGGAAMKQLFRNGLTAP